MEERHHGGYYGEGKVIDFSTNLNPLGTPKCISKLIKEGLTKGVYSRYPDYSYSELRSSIARFYKVDPENVIATNGASEALNLSILSLKPREVIIVGPSYGDYEILSRGIGLNCRYFLMKEKEEKFECTLRDLPLKDGSVIVITNPNNPTGIALDPRELISFAETLPSRTFVIIDEAYVELSEIDSALKYDLPENLVVVKSFTKIFSVPGLRLGFIYSLNGDVLRNVDSIRPTWNVNSFAEYVFKHALLENSDDLRKFIARSQRFVSYERERLVLKLRGLALQVYLSRANFLLIKHNGINTVRLKRELLKRYNILIRSAHTFFGLNEFYSRIAIKGRVENDLLVNALGDILERLR